jgi:hypothetical protein
MLRGSLGHASDQDHHNTLILAVFWISVTQDQSLSGLITAKIIKKDGDLNS